MLIEIRNRYTNNVMYACEEPSLKDALHKAIKENENLIGANLRGANLNCANLNGANLLFFKTDFFDTLIRTPKEIEGLKQALIDGKVNGSQYEGECACLVGTIANIRHEKYNQLGNGLEPNSSRPAERWFMGINEGDTPENNQISKITVEWIDEFKQLLETAKGV